MKKTLLLILSIFAILTITLGCAPKMTEEEKQTIKSDLKVALKNVKFDLKMKIENPGIWINEQGIAEYGFDSFKSTNAVTAKQVEQAINKDVGKLWAYIVEKCETIQNLYHEAVDTLNNKDYDEVSARIKSNATLDHMIKIVETTLIDVEQLEGLIN